MEGDTFSGLGNGAQIDAKIMQTFQKSFVQVQTIFDQNRLLINEINQNHESKVPDNLTRNVGLIRELNNNIRRVYDLYADLSGSFTKSMEVTSEGDSSGAVKSGNKRHRPVCPETVVKKAALVYLFGSQSHTTTGTESQIRNDVLLTLFF
ncbi:Protein ELF4-LIKE 3, partial [Mucuna pruriens]